MVRARPAWRAFRRLPTTLAVLGVLSVASACGPGADEDDAHRARIRFEVVATIDSPALNEISGMESADGPRLLVHNDDGGPEVFVLDPHSEVVARFHLKGARNRDWEDMSWVPHAGGRLLALGDIGDNLGRRSSIQIYFVDMPDPGSAGTVGGQPAELGIHHVVALTYPDGPHDCEAMAYDSSSGRILLLTKRDKPPQLYAADARRALSEAKLELEHLGSATTFRPPTRDDMRRLGRDGAWISQPTGMDINDDGTLAAVITYRSLYLFKRDTEQSWEEAFRSAPREFLGPPPGDEEAIAFSPDMQALYITSEGSPAPIYYVRLPE